MQLEVYRLASLAVACNIAGDEAYTIPSDDYLKEFIIIFESGFKGKRALLLDSLVRYVAVKTYGLQLPASVTLAEFIHFTTGNSEDTAKIAIEAALKNSPIEFKTLYSNLELIKIAFVDKTAIDMLTELASRRKVLDMLRAFLRSCNTDSSLTSEVFYSTRMDTVHRHFIEKFRRAHAHAFGFYGNLFFYIQHCFQNYYFLKNNKDIWNMLRAVDTSKLELEKNILVERDLRYGEATDLAIHDLLVNIVVANNAALFLPGHSEQTRGVVYELFYMIMCELCSRRVKAINEQLGKEVLEFHDIKLSNITAAGPKSMIAHVKEIVPLIFDEVHSGVISFDNLVSLRDVCFNRGMTRATNEPLWYADKRNPSFPYRRLHNQQAYRNYIKYDTIFKGVASIHHLMTGLEERGYTLVDFYNPDVFLNMDIIRHLDFLSAIPHIELIKQLQREPVSEEEGSGTLLNVWEMIDEYAGSSQNTGAAITANRRYAQAHGFLDSPRVKQATFLSSDYEIANEFRAYIQKIPRTFQEYLDDGACTLHSMCEHTTLLYNTFIENDTDRAQLYLGEGEQVHKLSCCAADLKFTCLQFLGELGYYMPLEGTLYFCNSASPSEWNVLKVEDIVQFLFQLHSKGKQEQLHLSSCTLEKSNKILRALSASKGAVPFSWSLGIEADRYEQVSPAVLEAWFLILDNFEILGEPVNSAKCKLPAGYKPFVTKFYQWVKWLFKLQRSLADVLHLIHSTVVAVNLSLIKGSALQSEEFNSLSTPEIKSFCEELLFGLQTGAFSDASLSWILQIIKGRAEKNGSIPKLSVMQWKGITIPTLGDSFNLTAIDVIFGKEKDIIPETLVKSYDTVGKTFVCLFNRVYLRLSFLRKFLDAYHLLVGVPPRDASTLVCELDSQFQVLASLSTANFKGKDIAITLKGAEALVREEILREHRICIQEFSAPYKLLFSFVEGHQKELTRLINYDLAIKNSSTGEFREWNKILSQLPLYSQMYDAWSAVVVHTNSYQHLLQKARVDETGFFILRSRYFRAVIDGDEYYVHQSGRVLQKHMGKLSTVHFNLDDIDDLRRYLDILGEGWN